jgi:hypothetical protein
MVLVDCYVKLKAIGSASGFSKLGDKPKEALIRVRLKNSICSPPFGRGWGRGAATAKRKANYL